MGGGSRSGHGYCRVGGIKVSGWMGGWGFPDISSCIKEKISEKTSLL